MNYFSGDLTRDKLIILCFLNDIKLELTSMQLLRIVVENDWVNYFDFQQSLTQLKEAGLIILFSTPAGEVYCITQTGSEAYEYFKKRLPESLREEIINYANEHRSELLKQTQFTASYLKNPNNSYTVSLKATELGMPLMEISLRAPSRQTAQDMCRNWQEKAEDVYRSLFYLLLGCEK